MTKERTTKLTGNALKAYVATHFPKNWYSKVVKKDKSITDLNEQFKLTLRPILVRRGRLAGYQARWT